MDFWKMNGAGNDFIVVDNRRLGLRAEQLSELAARLCRRRFSVGADGLIAVEEAAAGGDYRMLFFNADGSLGEMCGNGARCICRYGYENGLAGEIQHVETTAGMIVGRRLDRETYRVELNLPTVLTPRYQTAEGSWGYVELGNPGLPHLLVEVPSLEERDRQELCRRGRALRYDPALPKGANVNFFCQTGPAEFRILTYERGVEDFTLACGTGTGSLAALMTATGRTPGGEVRIQNPGGLLTVNVELEEGRITALRLAGPAQISYRGTVREDGQ